MIKPKAFADNFTNDIKIGITTGKLKIANKPVPALDFEAIAAVNVKQIENPTAANPKNVMNIPVSRT